MYIEELTLKDFEAFAKLFRCGVSEVRNVEDNEIYVQLFTGAMGPQPELRLSDFNLTTSTYYKSFEKQLKKRYIHFMHDKFGKKYQKDYTENYNIQKEEDRIL